MLMINLLAFALLLLNAIRRALLTFSPLQSTLDWYAMATSSPIRGDSSLSKKLSFYLYWGERVLTFSVGFHLVIQLLQGLLPPALVALTIFSAVLLLLACIDWFYFLLPNSLTFILIAFGIFSSTYLFDAELIDVLTRCAGCYGVLWIIQGAYYALRHEVGLGSGDVKLLTALASWFNTYQLCVLVLLASIIALPFCLHQYRDLGSLQTVIIPFGTFLSMSGLYCAFIFYSDILNSLLIAVSF